MPRQGEDFHRLVEQLERAVSGHDGVSIESPKYLLDKITGEPREHDIVLTYQAPHRRLVVAIECRDRSRPVSSGQVEEFRCKCLDTGVDKGIIVAARGFAGPARTKAAHHGIDCLTLAEVDQVDWCAQTEIVIRHRAVKHADIQIGLPLSVKGKTWRLYFRRVEGGDEWIDINGRPDNLLDAVWPQVPDLTSDLSGEIHIEIGNVRDFYLCDDEGNEHPVKALSLDITWQAVETTSPLTFYRYGTDIDMPVYETVVTGPHRFGELEGQVVEGRLMLIKDEKCIRMQFLTKQGTKALGQAAEPLVTPEAQGHG